MLLFLSGLVAGDEAGAALRRGRAEVIAGNEFKIGESVVAAQEQSGYVSYQATEKMSMNWRFDRADGSNGSFGSATPSGDPDELFSLTVTAGYSPILSEVSKRCTGG